MAENNNLGRDKVGWSQNIWNQIDQAVHDEVQRIRVAMKVFPVRPYPKATSVPADQVDLASMTIAEGGELPFLEISRTFSLTPSQIEKEPELGTAATLARLAAAEVILAEERLLFQGQAPNPALPGTIRVLNLNQARDGLLGAAPRAIQVPQGGQAGMYGESSFDGVVRGINQLLDDVQPGPYALILSTSIFADTYRPLQGTLIAPADRIKPLVPGGFVASVGIPPNGGLLVSLGGEPANLAVSVDTIAAFTQQDAEGLYRFRVFERIQFVVRDPRALLRLEFQ